MFVDVRILTPLEHMDVRFCTHGTYLLSGVVFPVGKVCCHRAVHLVPVLDAKDVYNGRPQARRDVSAIVPVGVKRLTRG